LDSKATKWKAKPIKTLWANLCFFSDRRLIVFQKSHAFRFLLFLLNKRNAVENLFYILILAQRQSSEHRAMVARPSSDRRTTVKRRSLRKYKLSLFAKRTVHEGPAWGKMNTFNEWVNNVVQEDIYGRTDGQPVTKTANLHTNYTVTKEHYFVTFIELD
jgi:hypothetical protein